MAGRMPVLRQHDMAKALRHPVDCRHHRVAVTDRQCTARAKIILHVDNEKQVVMRVDLHLGLLLETMTVPNTGIGLPFSIIRNRKANSRWPPKARAGAHL